VALGWLTQAYQLTCLQEGGTKHCRLAFKSLVEHFKSEVIIEVIRLIRLNLFRVLIVAHVGVASVRVELHRHFFLNRCVSCELTEVNKKASWILFADPCSRQLDPVLILLLHPFLVFNKLLSIVYLLHDLDIFLGADFSLKRDVFCLSR